MLYTRVMVTEKKRRPLYQRVLIDAAGFSLMFISPFLGWLPGPGGIPLFLAGLGLVSLNHEWAERLLKNFDAKRRKFTNKYLVSSPKVSAFVDIIIIAAFSAGVYLALFTNQNLTKIGGLFLASISVIIFFSNQKRFEKIIKKIRDS